MEQGKALDRFLDVGNRLQQQPDPAHLPERICHSSYCQALSSVSKRPLKITLWSHPQLAPAQAPSRLLLLLMRLKVPALQCICCSSCSIADPCCDTSGAEVWSCWRSGKMPSPCGAALESELAAATPPQRFCFFRTGLTATKIKISFYWKCSLYNRWLQYTFWEPVHSTCRNRPLKHKKHSDQTMKNEQLSINHQQLMQISRCLEVPPSLTPEA